MNKNDSTNVTVLSQADQKLSAEILFAFSIASSNTAYKYGDVATNIFPRMFHDSQIAKDFSCGRKKISYLISDGIGHYIKEELINEVRKSNSYYTIQIDETPISEKRVKQLDINIRFYSEKQEEIVSHHLESCHIGQATAEILYEKIMNALVELPSEKLVNVFTDGPNVMKSLKKKLRVHYPNLLDIGTCNLHVIHNGFAKGLESFGGDIESLVIDLYYFFKHSAVQSENFQDLQIKFGAPEHILLRHVDSRWLTLHSTLNRFIEQFDVLKDFFNAKQKLDSARYKRICEFFASQTLLPKALFLRNVANLFSNILSLFQQEEPLVHILYDEHEQLLKKLFARFLITDCFSDVSGPGLLHIDVHKSENWLPSVEVGVDTELALKKLNDSARKSFYLGARSFYLTCTKYLIQKLPLDNKLLKNMKCLHPLYISEPSSIKSIKILASAVPFLVPDNKVSELVDEWICLQAEDLNILDSCKNVDLSNAYDSDEEHTETTTTVYQRIDHFWSKVFKMNNNFGHKKYKLITEVVKTLLTLPHGNAGCERGFSINKCLLEKRSSLNIASINGLRQIKSHMKRCNNDIQKIVINQSLLNAAKNSRQMYKKRLEEEKKIISQNKRNISSNKTDSLQETLNEERLLQNQLLSTQTMLNLAEKHIEDGLKVKDLQLIESGQILLKEAKEKIPVLTQKIKDNKEEQLKLREQITKKRKR